MPVRDEGIGGFPTKFQTKCIFYNNETVYKVKVILEGTETSNIQVDIGTASTISGTYTWQENITQAEEITLTNPNKAIKLRMFGATPSTITRYSCKCLT